MSSPRYYQMRGILPSMSAVDVLGLVGMTVPPVRFDACVDSGGFGLVYRARHLSLDSDVAVKCLRIANLGRLDDNMKQAVLGRFRDETRLMYRLSQGCLDIVRCIGSGELVSPVSGEITPYMILEWLEGQSLSHDLRERRDKSMRPRTLEEAVALLDSAATAVAYAHEQGVVHRDIKPGNLFFTQTPTGVRLKVLDFGLAKILDDEAIGLRPSVETGIGMAMCSPSYGAPEQFNSTIGPIGPWTDVYSLTLVLLELMRGEKVRPASNLADGLLAAIDPERGSPRASQLGIKVSRNIEDLLHRALAQNPLERPRDAGVFWNALKELVKQSQMAATVMDANVMDAMDRVRAAQHEKAQRFQQTQRTADAPPIPAAPQTQPGPHGHAKQQLAGTLMLGSGPPPPNIPQPAPTPTPATKPMAKAPPRGPTTAPLPPIRMTAAQADVRTTAPSMRKSASPPPKPASSIVSAIVVFFAIVIVGGGGVVAYWWFRMR
jgi:eukaryotic-like serine/threonine-protein kinase